MTYIHQDLTNQKNHTQVIDTVYVLRDVQRCSHVFVVCVALCRHGSEQFAKDVKKNWYKYHTDWKHISMSVFK